MVSGKLIVLRVGGKQGITKWEIKKKGGIKRL